MATLKVQRRETRPPFDATVNGYMLVMCMCMRCTMCGACMYINQTIFQFSDGGREYFVRLVLDFRTASSFYLLSVETMEK